MDLYLVFFGFGLVGLVLMAVFGFAGGHGASHGSHGHLGGGARSGSHSVAVASTSGAHGAPGHGGAGAAHGSASHGLHGHAGGNGHAASNHGAHHPTAATAGNQVRSFLVGWLTPRVLFTLSLGGGAAGLAVSSLVVEPWRGLIALSGGALLEKLVVSPLWLFFMSFASHPARNLESAVFEEAVALTNFDGDGCGIVAIQLDGHEMRALGRLGAQFAGHKIRQGDPLLVESVDGARGRCVVTPLPAPIAGPTPASPPPPSATTGITA